MATFTIPPAPSEPLLTGLPNQVTVSWYRFFLGVFETVGSGVAPISLGQLIAYFTNQRIALVVPSWLRVFGSPITGATGLNGTFTVQSATVAANEVLASPNGASGPLTPRLLVGADLPNPTATTKGGVKAIAPIASNFLTSIGTDGTPTEAQPAFSDISGSIAGSQSAVGVATNSNAHAGYPGEFITSSVAVGAAVALTTGVAANVTSIALTDGDWDLYGNIYFAPAGTTVIATESGGISDTTATLPTAPAGGYTEVNGVTIGAGAEVSLTLGYTRMSLASPATVYLVAQAAFSVSTCGAYGIISARRSANVF